MEKTNQNLLQKLTQILNVDKIMSPDDVLAIRDALIGVLANNKKELENLTDETKQAVNSILDKVLNEHDTYLEKTKQIAQEAKSETTEAINSTLKSLEEVKVLCKEVMECKPENGEDADEEYVIGEVLNRIKLPEYKEIVLDDGGAIVDKINSLPVNEENQIDAKHIKNLPEFKNGRWSGITKGAVIKLIEESGAAGVTLKVDGTENIEQGTLDLIAGSGITIVDNGDGTVTFTATGGGGGSGSPGGSDTQVQFNDGGSFGGDAGLTYNKTTDSLTIGGGLTVDTNTLYVDATNNMVGVGTTSPTHSLTLPSTSTGIAIYNTADQTTNYERMEGLWSSNEFLLRMAKGGTGTQRNVKLVSHGILTIAGSASSSGDFIFRGSTSGANAVNIVAGSTYTATSGVNTEVSIKPVINQSSTAGYTALLVNPTETTTGSGSKLLADFQVGGSSKFSIDNTGVTSIPVGSLTVGTASTAGTKRFVFQGNPSGTLGEFRTGSNNGFALSIYNDTYSASNSVFSYFPRTTGTFEQGTDQATDLKFYTNGYTNTRLTILSTGNIGVMVTNPTAYLHIKAGTATANTAPIKLAPGTPNTTPEAGTLEFTNAEDGLTFTAVSTRRKVVLDTATQTITGKRNQPRIVSAASYTTDTGTSLDFSTCDEFIVTAQAGALKFNNPSGSPVQGEKIIIRIKDNGTARALTYDTQYRAIGVTLPTTTVISKTLYLGGIWNATDSKLDITAVAQEA